MEWITVFDRTIDGAAFKNKEYTKSISTVLQDGCGVTSPITYNDDRELAWSGTFNSISSDCGVDDNNFGTVAFSNNITKTISPAYAGKVKITIPSDGLKNTLTNSNRQIEFYAGTAATGSPIITLTSSSTYTTFTVNDPAVTIRFTGSGSSGEGRQRFKFNWEGLYDNSYNMPTVTPDLALKKVILFRNEEFTGINAPSAFSFTDNFWDASNCNYSGNPLYNLAWYTTNKTSIDNACLKQVDFTQDYSLCRIYPNNINTKIDWTVGKYALPPQMQDGLSPQTSSYLNSGKLTLNEINFYNKGYHKIVPSVKFDYNACASCTTGTDDNPDFNVQKVDYSGYYNSDVSTNAFSTYTSSTSAALADAWSLRKITLPSGGTIEMEYEGNRYKYVLSGKGGLKGPQKTFLIDNISSFDAHSSNYYGRNFQFDIEDDNSGIQNLLTGTLPSGSTKNILIPFRCLACTSANATYDNLAINITTANHSISYGSGHYSVTDLNIYSKTNHAVTNGIDGYADLTGTNFFGGAGTPTYDEFYYTDNVNNHLKYTLNGFVQINFPRGYEVYGNGPRVKKIKVNNPSASETFIKEYTYYDGVVTRENDRFNGFFKYSLSDIDAVTYDENESYFYKLHSFESNFLELPPMLGYSRVKEQSFNLNNETQGYSEYTYLTNDTLLDNFKINNKQVVGTRTTTYDCDSDPNTNNEITYSDTSNVYEVLDKFSSLWGSAKESKSYDKFGNLIARNVNTFVNTDEGRITELAEFESFHNSVCDVDGSNNSTYCSVRNISILRNYKSFLSKTESYSQAGKQSTEYRDPDLITGAPKYTRSIGLNGDIAVSKSKPAFRISTYSATGPKSLSASNTNQLNLMAESQSYSDTALTGTTDFNGYSVSTLKNNCQKRLYDAQGNDYGTSSGTLLYYLPGKSYAWTGPVTSSGLFTRSSLVAFNYSGTPDASWRNTGEATLYDDFGNVLETKSFKDRYSAARYDHDGLRLLASSGNSNLASFTYCGAEYEMTDDADHSVLEGEFIFDPDNCDIVTSTSTIKAHTGSQLIKINTGTYVGPTYKAKFNSTDSTLGLTRGRTYHISAWVHQSSPNDAALVVELTGSKGGTSWSETKTVARNSADGIQIGQWILLSTDIYVPYNYTSSGFSGTPVISNNDLSVYVKGVSGSTAYFDDICMHSTDAGFSATVYDNVKEQVSETIDDYGFATRYKYDQAGRKTQVFTEIEGVGTKLLSKLKYNFARGLN